MKKTLGLSRRDFVSGVALGAAALKMTPLEAAAKGLLPSTAIGPDYYPPGLTGMRGSTKGSFETAHAVAREGRSFSIPKQQTEKTYDLVVVGAGISGLSAAKFFRDQQEGPSRILVLDNHDDFGGHARRNELQADGETLIGFGGSQTIDSPSKYSAVAKQLLKDLSIDVDRFYDYFDQSFFKRRDMGAGIYFDAKSYGERKMVANPLDSDEMSESQLLDAVRSMPIPSADREAFFNLLAGGTDYLQGMSTAEKETLLRNTSYLEFLETHAGAPESVREILRDSFLPMIGVGWEAASAWEAAEYEFPGTGGLGLKEEQHAEREEPYIHHFPDGNASIARALVRNLVPKALPGSGMESLVSARADYAALDDENSNIRIRLNSTVVRVQNTGDEVDITYVNNGNSYRVRAKHVVMACYNAIIPHVCPEVPPAQAEAIRYATKIPFVIGSFAIRNWQAFADAGFYKMYTPGDAKFKYLHLDFPVSMGNYQYSQSPDKPIVVSAWYSPTQRGLTNTQQYKAGRAKLLQMSYNDFEEDIFRHFDGMLGPHGFDAERDFAAITLNRWPHGYAYEFEGIGVPAEYDRYTGPHIIGRAQIGRISIANSDSEAYAYVDGAIDAAYRAVNEQLQV
ncbi:MAG: FAD-dependent oxidoreductase [Halioglobus sp.]